MQSVNPSIKPFSSLLRETTQVWLLQLCLPSLTESVGIDGPKQFGALTSHTLVEKRGVFCTTLLVGHDTLLVTVMFQPMLLHLSWLEIKKNTRLLITSHLDVSLKKCLTFGGPQTRRSKYLWQFFTEIICCCPSFEAKKKAGAVFIYLRAAYDTVWHRGLTCKLLRLLPDKHMVKMIMELVRNRSFTLTTVSLVYSATEYCAPVWCRSAHTRLIDSVLNDALRIVTVCLRPTPTDHLPILSSIQPAELRRLGATLSLAYRGSLDPDHILHGHLSGSSDTRQVRLRSRRPFVPGARNRLDNLARLGIRASEWTNLKWKSEYCENASRLRAFVPETGSRPVGMGLPRAAWLKLNRLRTGVERFHSSMHKWSIASSPNCECGASDQTADHVLTACPIHRAPHGARGLTVLDDETRCWLNDITASIWFRQCSSLG